MGFNGRESPDEIHPARERAPTGRQPFSVSYYCRERSGSPGDQKAHTHTHAHLEAPAVSPAQMYTESHGIHV